MVKFGPEEGSKQFCFACMSEVEFPHQCPNLFGKANTHDFKECNEHEWHGPKKWVRCFKCLWHIEISSVPDVAACPKDMSFDIYKDVWPGTVKNGEMPCPTCAKPMKKLFTKKDDSVTRYVCTKCHPLTA